jgi:hydrogenase maturation factor
MKNLHPVYPLGKLPPDELAALLARYTGGHDPQLIQGPGPGCDAAVIDYGDRYLVVKSDPITFATDEIGWYAVHVNANDIACLGARPRWFIATLLLPAGRTDAALIETIFQQLHNASREIGVTIVGGHTEVTYGLDRPIVIGSMLGEVTPERLVRSTGAQAGDHLILTKGIAVEGTALLAREAADRLRDRLPAAWLERAAGFLHHPGISILKDALTAAAAGRIHAMHDPTEGGVATGLAEIAGAAGLGLEIAAEKLPIYPETRACCDALGLDPLGLIASGSLLAAVSPQESPAVVAALEAAGIPAAVIGTFTAAPELWLKNAAGRQPLPTFARDEIARFFDAAD